MAKRLTELFMKGKKDESFKPLKEILDKKRTSFPLVLTVLTAGVMESQFTATDEDTLQMYIERRTKLSFLKLKVVDIPNLDSSKQGIS